MEKSLWINLPVKNLIKSKEFFLEIGFKENPEFPGNDNAASFLVGDNKVGLMLFDESTFKGFRKMKLQTQVWELKCCFQ